VDLDSGGGKKTHETTFERFPLEPLKRAKYVVVRSSKQREKKIRNFTT
jgi:hypothetical protein